jgi:RNAse (barnase) inhibitor barstar
MKNEIERVLDGSVTPGIYRLTSRAGATTIAAQAERGGWRFFHLEGKHIASKAEFLQACAEAMRFPGYFGHNWDALEDSLRDLSWAPATRGYVVLYDGAGQFAAAQPTDFAVALDILRSAAASWRDTATPMIVLMRGAGNAGLSRL